MHIFLKLGAALGLASLGLVALPAVHAQTTTAFFSGTFNQDDDKRLFTFNVTTPGDVTFFTTSYGGTSTSATRPVINVDGSSTVHGGFDTIISLFDPSGNFVFANDDSPIQVIDPTTHVAFDAGFTQSLTTLGTYTAVVTEFSNFSNADPTRNFPPTTTSLAGGFQQDEQGNFTHTFGGGNVGTKFIDFTGSQRTGNFNLNIAGGTFGTLPSVPEASTTVSFGLLLALGLGGVAFSARRKAQAQAE